MTNSIIYDRHPDNYRHWILEVCGPVATLTLDIDEDGGGETRASVRLQKAMSTSDLGPPADDREALTRLYERVAPEKLGNIDGILAKFEGDADKMYALLIPSLNASTTIKIP